MPWVESSNGIWERPIGDNEAFIKLVGDTGLPLEREHWSITSQASFIPKGILDVERYKLEGILRDAWKQLRFSQPSIAARATSDKITYQVPNGAELESWVNETFIVLRNGTSPADVIANRKPSPYSVLHYLPSDSRVVLQTSHWRTDGIGILLILDAYSELVCQIAAGTAESMTWGTETSRLSLSVEEVANLSQDPTPDVTATAERYLATFNLTANTVGVNYQGSSDTPPGSTIIKLLEFSESESSAIFVAARSQHISVTSVVHASVALANYSFAEDHNKSKPYTSTIRFGLRPYVPAQYAGRESGSTLLTSGYMFQVRPNQSWLEIASKVNAEYRKGYTELMPAHRQYAKMLCDVMRNMPPPDPNNLPSDMDISTVGVADKFIKPSHKTGDAELEVTEVSIGTEILTRQMVCFEWTFRGRLNLQINYNQAYHDEAQVRSILQYIKDVIMKELGIDSV